MVFSDDSGSEYELENESSDDEGGKPQIVDRRVQWTKEQRKDMDRYFRELPQILAVDMDNWMKHCVRSLQEKSQDNLKSCIKNAFHRAIKKEIRAIQRTPLNIDKQKSDRLAENQKNFVYELATFIANKVGFGSKQAGHLLVYATVMMDTPGRGMHTTSILSGRGEHPSLKDSIDKEVSREFHSQLKACCRPVLMQGSPIYSTSNSSTLQATETLPSGCSDVVSNKGAAYIGNLNAHDRSTLTTPGRASTHDSVTPPKSAVPKKKSNDRNRMTPATLERPADDNVAVKNSSASTSTRAREGTPKAVVCSASNIRSVGNANKTEPRKDKLNGTQLRNGSTPSSTSVSVGRRPRLIMDNSTRPNKRQRSI